MLSEPVHPIRLSNSAPGRKPSAEGEGGENEKCDECEEQRPEERGADRKSHRPEHTAFETLQEKDGQIDGDDNNDAEGHRSSNTMSCRPYSSKPGLSFPALLQTVNRVLHRDHGTIDDHPKVDGSEAHEIGTEAKEPHIDQTD